MVAGHNAPGMRLGGHKTPANFICHHIMHPPCLLHRRGGFARAPTKNKTQELLYIQLVIGTYGNSTLNMYGYPPERSHSRRCLAG